MYTVICMTAHPVHGTNYIAFLVNYFEPTIRLPVEIVPGCVLRKATAEEQAVFQKYDEVAHFGRGDSRIRRYRVPLIGDIKEQTNEDFAGYILEFGLPLWARHGNESHSEYERLELASSVSDAGLRPVIVCENRPKGLEPYFFTHDIHRHTVLRSRALSRFLKKIPTLTEGDLAEIRELTNRLRELKPEHRFAIEAIERFTQVEVISLASDFHTFGLFTIIEYLLTHSPKKNDENDTLTKQMRRKCPAVAATFDQSVSPGSYFDGLAEDKAWKILYSYRSAIAHGGSVGFTRTESKGGFAQLKNRKGIDEFLYLFTRRLLKSAVHEPDTVATLKHG